MLGSVRLLLVRRGPRALSKQKRECSGLGEALFPVTISRHNRSLSIRLEVNLHMESGTARALIWIEPTDVHAFDFDDKYRAHDIESASAEALQAISSSQCSLSYGTSPPSGMRCQRSDAHSTDVSLK